MSKPHCATQVNSKNPEIRNNVMQSRQTSTLFIRTNEEFVLNDWGTVTERQSFDNKKMIEEPMLKNYLSKQLKEIGVEPTEHNIVRFLNSHQYIDIYEVFPITSTLAAILVNPSWTNMVRANKTIEEIHKFGLHSDFLEKYYKRCEQKYVNKSKIFEPILRYGNTPQAIQKINENIFSGIYTDSKDEFTYPIQTIDGYYTAYLNSLMINETEHYLGFKSIEKVITSIYYYNNMRKHYAEKNDLTWINNDTNWDVPLN